MAKTPSLPTVKVKLVGVADLLMHNGRLADPLHPLVKELKTLSAKRKKTDADHEEMGRIEFLGGLYVNEDQAPVIPADNLEACLVKAARESKLGKKFLAGVLVTDDALLEFKGPKTPDALWKAVSPEGERLFVDRRPARVGAARVIRTRPRFRNWGAVVQVTYVPDLVDEAQVYEALDVAGRNVGLCDYAPKYGRFSVERVK